MSLFKLPRWSGLALLAALTVPAQAALMVNIGGTLSGGNVVGGIVYTDNQPGVDANLALGVLDLGAYLDTVASNFNINAFTVLSASPIGSLASTANVNLKPAVTLPVTVNVFLTDTGFLLPPTPLQLAQTVNLLSSVGGLTVTSVSTGYFGANNLAFEVDGSSTANALAAVKNGVAVNSTGFSGLIDDNTPYSLTTHIQLTLAARGTDPIQNLQVNSNLSATGQQGPVIPEPSTAAFGGIALLGLGLASKKLRKGKDAA
jgi:hypothetical protein